MRMGCPTSEFLHAPALAGGFGGFPLPINLHKWWFAHAHNRAKSDKIGER